MTRLSVLGAMVFASACGGGSDGPVAAGGSVGSAGTPGGAGTAAAGTSGSGNAGSAPVAGSSGSGNGGTTGGSGAAGQSGSVAGGGSGNPGAAGSGAAGAASAPLFSDDFEAASISSKWTPRINGGVPLELSTAQKHGGNQSLHLKHNGFSSFLAAEGAPIFPAPNNTFYGRLWLRVAPPLPTGHVVWFEAGLVENDKQEIRVGMNIGKFQSNLWLMGEVDIRDPDAMVKTDTWMCVQFKYGNDVLDVSLDNVHSSISTTTWVAADQANGSGSSTPKTGWSPTYAAFRLGWELGMGEVWYDDVALGHAPIACN